MATVYLIHFDKPLVHAKHYIGWTNGESTSRRLAKHRSGNGARILQVCNERSIHYDIVRTWENLSCQEARDLERRLKSWHKSRQLCPVCNPGNWYATVRLKPAIEETLIPF